MAAVLIHVDTALGPLGAWMAVDDNLESIYAPPSRTAEAVAYALLHARGDTVPWEAWFQRLADRTSYTVQFYLTTDYSQPLAAVLAAEQQRWNTHRIGAKLTD
jgi:hypothetical protein